MMARLNQLLGGKGELALVAGMVAILIVLFTPIPSWLLDFLLLLNLTFALTALLLTFYTDKPLAFSTFPSLLLIATLFRLSLNIAATRLILDQADAGRVIESIGAYVVGGNFVIGLVVFFILIVVQYVVVTNGAQRVAEVAARFTLDSMPGKQMSIDADLNMGLIDEHEARERRLKIEKEGNFYGAMDGASKFVKGDAIAGIIIILIDIIGGLSIGIAQLGMSWGEALERYTLLTVGDGIVTQIPALIIATATGIIVTRAANDAKLGEEIVSQLTDHPKTFVMIGLALLVALTLPGLPKLPILVILTAVVVLGVFSWRRSNMLSRPSQDDDSADGESDDVMDLLDVEPVEIQVGHELGMLVGGESGALMDRVGTLRKKLATDLGLILPKVRLKDSRKLGAGEYRVFIYGTKVGEGHLQPDGLLAINPGGKRPELEGETARDPSYGLPATWIKPEQQQDAQSAGYTVVDPLTVLATHFSEIVKQQASNLLTRAETEQIVNRVREKQPSLVEELLPNVLSLSDIQAVFRQLLREQVSIRHAELILEVLVDKGKGTKEPEALTEIVRREMGGALCQGLVARDGELHVLTLDPTLEQLFSSSMRKVEDRTTVVVEPKLTEQLVKSLASQVERMLNQDLMPVLLCAPSLRRHLRGLTERVLPHLTVLSLSEVPNSVNIRSFGVVSAKAA